MDDKFVLEEKNYVKTSGRISLVSEKLKRTEFVECFNNPPVLDLRDRLMRPAVFEIFKPGFL